MFNANSDEYLYVNLRSTGELGLKVGNEIPLQTAVYDAQYFSDGEVFVKFTESIRGKRLILFGQVHMPYRNLFEMYLAVDAARRASAKEIICVIPYLPHSRQERKDAERTSIAARIMADFLEYAGAARLVTIELHSNVIEGFYHIPVDHLRTSRIISEIIRKQGYDDLCLVSPDFGGLKRIKSIRSALPEASLAVINKERIQPNQVHSMEIIGEVAGKRAVIVDDLIDTAGTVCQASQLLMERGASSVEVIATHGLLSGSALEKIAASPIHKVYISDTIPLDKQTDKIEIFSIADLVISGIKSIINNESIHRLNEF